MNKKKRTGLVLLTLIILVIAVLFLVLIFSIYLSGSDKRKCTVGFISTGNSEEVGWNGTHIRGIREVCKEMDVRLLVKENIKEYTGECIKAAEELLSEGSEMMILNSYGYEAELADFIAEHPEISFYVNNSEAIAGSNVSTYFVRMYQVRYLSGIIAGMKTETNKIGYVAAMSNNEVNRGINAFTLGVKKINPEAQVVVAWTESWDNAEVEKAAVHRLVEEHNIDVVSYHQNQSYTIEAAEEEGIYSIGYHQAFDNFSEKCLTSVVGNWDSVYREILREYQKGNGNKTGHYWFGLEENAVCLTEYSEEVTPEIQAQVNEAANQIRRGKDVFFGEIRDTEGKIRCNANESISDKVLIEESDWFVDGVIFLNKDEEGKRE
ncbi:MAG: BMP family ABC transporter substrate-binding protein [Acetatifactor sp.]